MYVSVVLDVLTSALQTILFVFKTIQNTGSPGTSKGPDFWQTLRVHSFLVCLTPTYKLVFLFIWVEGLVFLRPRLMPSPQSQYC